MEKEEITQLKSLLRKYISTYIEPNADVTDQARQMYVQVLNWIVIDDAEGKH